MMRKKFSMRVHHDRRRCFGLAPCVRIDVASIKNEIREFVLGKKMKTVLIIDEASLLRMEVFAELHTLVQFLFKIN